MKKLSKILCILVISLLTLGVFAGCGGGDSVSEIYVKKGDMPQVTVVQGNDLDLSKGALTLVKKGGEQTIPFTTEGVTVSGYDNTVLGAQTVTLTYKGKTTTLDVTVIPRMLILNVDTNYFLDDEPNTAKGQLRIAKDDGTTFTVPLSAETVSIENFDTSVAATGKTVTVRYTSGTTEYVGTYEINVFAPENITMTTPSKTKYGSHETELDLSGVFFTVEANGGQMTKYVNVLPSMVKGYQPELATMENRTEPLKQTLTVEYLNFTKQYDVYITYSGVSIFRQAAKELSVLDWNADKVTINEEQGSFAIDAMQEYYKLSSTNKALITEEEKVTVVRTAAVWGLNQLKKEAESFSDTFVIAENGAINYIGKSYESVKKDYNRLLDSNEPFVAYSNMLHSLIAEFGDLVIGGNITVGSYLGTLFKQEELQLLMDLNKLLIELYESLEPIPENWTMEDLKPYGAQIGAVAIRISGSPFKGYYYSSFYDALSSWRPDFFDIVYSYYLYHEDDSKKDAIGTTLWDVVPQPGPLQEIFLAIVNGINEENHITQNSPLWFDTSLFMMFYKEAKDLKAEIENGDNQFYKDLYAHIDYDEIINRYFVTSTSGYVTLGDALFGDPAYEAFWDEYLTLAKEYYYHGVEFNLIDKGAQVSSIFKSFVNLSPSWQRGVLNTMYTLYNEVQMEASVFEFTANHEVNSYFVFFLAGYYTEVLPESAHGIFQKLLYAIEDYATRYKYTDGLSSFKSLMGEIQADFDKLSTEDKIVFNQHLGFVYDKYMAIADGETIDLGDWADDFETMQGYVKEFAAVSDYLGDIDVSNEEKEGVHVVLFSIYEKAAALAATINACNDAAIIRAFNTVEYPIGAMETNITLEYAMYQMRDIFIGYMTNSKITIPAGTVIYSYTAWELYHPTEVEAYLAQISDTLYRYFKGEECTAQEVAAMAVAFRALDQETQKVFFILDPDAVYYGAMDAAYGAIFTEGEMEVYNALVKAEKAYAAYLSSKTAVALSAYKTAIAEVTALLGGEFDQASENYVTYLKEMYEYYEVALGGTLSEADAAILAALVEVEEEFQALVGNVTDEGLAAFKTAVEAVTALLGGEYDQTSETYVTYFKNVYESYLKQYNALNS